MANLSSLHHSALRRPAEAGRKVNWPAMSLATLKLNEERPTAADDDETWMRWSPLDRLGRLYEELAPVTPDDRSVAGS